MLVSNSSLLNILLPNSDNKVLKDVLKNADKETLESIKKDPSSIKNILKNLFTELKTGDKTNANIENILKNSNLFKDLGNFTKTITTLINQSKDNPELSKYKPILQSFLKNIDSLDAKSLKEMITKSGIFLESKGLEQLAKQTQLPKNIEDLLLKIKTVLKEINTPEAKNIQSNIDKILQNNKTTLDTTKTSQNIKQVVSMLQNLTKNVGDKQLANLNILNNNLAKVLNETQLLESKINNQSNIKATNIESLKQDINNNTKEILSQLKTQLTNTTNIPNKTIILKQIDSLLNSPNLFSKNETMAEPKELLNQLINLKEIKTASIQHESITKNINILKNQIETISNLETKILKNQNIQFEKTQVLENINEALKSLKTTLMLKNIDSKPVNQLIDKLLNLQNIFNKIEIPMELKNFQTNTSQTNLLNSFQSNFSSNISNIILSIKDALNSLGKNEQTGLNIQQNIIKNINNLENSLNNFLQLNPNTSITDKNIQQNPLQNDMKAVLLQMQEEISNKTDIKSTETIKQIDKMITQIEYFQLLSSVSNSNSVYIPFIWDILDEGSISMKKLNEEKFYCEINLSLKEFGQTQLMLALYDKNKLDLTIHASKDSFKKLIQENLPKLRQALNQVDLIPSNIKIIDLKKEKPKKEEQKIIYSQNNNISLGLNIRV